MVKCVSLRSIGRKSASSVSNPRDRSQIREFGRKFVQSSANPKIRAQIQKFERKSKNSSANPKIRAQIHKFERKSVKSRENTKISEQICFILRIDIVLRSLVTYYTTISDKIKEFIILAYNKHFS